MVKFKIDNDNHKIIGLGLTYKNLQKLKAGHPVSIKLSELNIDSEFEIFLFAGENELEMTEDLSRFIGPNTKTFGI